MSAPILIVAGVFLGFWLSAAIRLLIAAHAGLRYLLDE
jgi:hypothetical protein